MDKLLALKLLPFALKKQPAIEKCDSKALSLLPLRWMQQFQTTHSRKLLEYLNYRWRKNVERINARVMSHR